MTIAVRFLSYFKGVDMSSIVWTTTLHEEALPRLADEAHSVECDGLCCCMLLRTHQTLATRTLKVVHVQVVADLEYLFERYPYQADIAQIGGPDARRNGLAIRRKLTVHARMLCCPCWLRGLYSHL